MKLVTWQKNYTRQQRHTWRAFETIANEEISVIVCAPPSSLRLRQGWQFSDLTQENVEKLPAAGWWQRGKAMLDAQPQAIHLFSGFFGERKFLPLMAYAAWKGYRICVLQEAYAEQPVGYMQEEKKWVSALKLFGRPLLYRAIALFLQAFSSKSAPCILAISPQGVRQMRRAGFRREQVFPFGYFIPRQETPPPPPRIDSSLRLIFLGALLRRKGLDIAIEAVKKLAAQGYALSLDIFGYGNPADFFTPAPGLPIRYGGVLPLAETQSVIRQYDALILPSRHDGWGVVVNEALLQGVPVIISRQSGAHCLIRASGAGAVFDSQDAASLTAILRQALDNPQIFSSWQENARRAGEQISPEAAAKYVYNVFLSHFFHQEIPHSPVLWDESSF
ncbi:MAG: hypothetical protein OHK0031_06690 [Anaerolineales bacterium]